LRVDPPVELPLADEVGQGRRDQGLEAVGDEQKDQSVEVVLDISTLKVVFEPVL
jgi:hypothetical protein